MAEDAIILGKEKDNYDLAIYDTGINWCHFQIQCGSEVACFRLHMEDDLCWDLFKILDGGNLYPSLNCSMTFRYGKKEPKPFIKINQANLIDINDLKNRFTWLRELFRPSMSFGNDPLHYHGVQTYKLK
jgi:hypothetical protein